MRVSCPFVAIALLLVRESQSVPILSGVTNSEGGIVPTRGKLNDLSAPAIPDSVEGFVPGLSSTVKNVMAGVLGADNLRKREPTASPPTMVNLQNDSEDSSGEESGYSAPGPVSTQPLVGVGKVPSLTDIGSIPPVGSVPSLPAVGALPKVPSVGTVADLKNSSDQGLSGVKSTLHQTGSSALGPVSSQPLIGVGKVPSLTDIGSLPPVGSVSSLPAVGALPKVLSVGNTSASVGSGLPLGAVPSAPLLPDVGSVPSVPAVGTLPKVPSVGNTLASVGSGLPLGSIPSAPSLPDLGTLSSLPAVPKVPLVKTTLPNVLSGLPLGAVPSVPKLSGATDSSHYDR